MIDIGMLRIRPTTIAIRIRKGTRQASQSGYSIICESPSNSDPQLPQVKVAVSSRCRSMLFSLINNKPLTKRELVRAVSWGSGTPGTP